MTTPETPEPEGQPRIVLPRSKPRGDAAEPGAGASGPYGVVPAKYPTRAADLLGWGIFLALAGVVTGLAGYVALLFGDASYDEHPGLPLMVAGLIALGVGAVLVGLGIYRLAWYRDVAYRETHTITGDRIG